MAEQNTGMNKGRKLLIGLIIVLLLLTAGAWIFGVHYFTEHFLPGSLVNGFNCSYMTQEEAEDLLKKKTEVYALAIRTRGNGVESLYADEISLKYSSDGSVNRLLHKQNRFGWFLAFGQHKEYTLASSVTFDEALFEQKINSLNCMQDNIEPVDAYIKENEDGFEVVSEIEGNRIDRDSLCSDLKDAVTTGRTEADLEADGCYIDPQVYAEDLTKDCQQMNELTDVVITYDFGDRKETIDRSVLKNWLTRDENNDLILNRDSVSDFVVQLAEKYDTVDTDHTFSTYDDQDIIVSGGTYGWRIDQEKETDALYQAIIDKKTQVREPVYKQEAQSRDTNDIGYSYIEIDLNRQRMVLYQSGSPIVDTGFIAGSSTPTGVFALGDKESSKESDATAGKNLSCWMPFTETLGIFGDADLLQSDIAFYASDADFSGAQESEFTSYAYLWKGTEGCVVVPLEQAEMIYQNVSTGFPVVIY